MLASVSKLVEHVLTGNRTPKRIGNHWCERRAPNYWQFFYHETCVCAADTQYMTVMFTNGGWNTSSTTRTVNSYRDAFVGFHELPVEEFLRSVSR